jgi:hypothetical protein
VLEERRRDPLHKLDLFIAAKASSFDEYDASVELARAYELLEVANVQCDEDAILLVGTIE